MPRPPVSVTIIALNEEKDIAYAIQSVSSWADEVLVVDSGSTDRTLEVARSLGARVIQRAWPGYGQQKNFAQAQAAHDWVLNIDSDERMTPELRREIEVALVEVGEGRSRKRGFFFPRKTFYIGRWIRHGGWYPNCLTRLADRRYARWTEPAVHEELRVQGEIGGLHAPLEHHSFESIADQVRTNLRFACLGSEQLRAQGRKPSLAKLFLKPAGKFLETYLIKRGFLDGTAGLIISINAAYSMFLKYAFPFEARIAGKTEKAHESPRHRQ